MEGWVLNIIPYKCIAKFCKVLNQNKTCQCFIWGITVELNMFPQSNNSQTCFGKTDWHFLACMSEEGEDGYLLHSSVCQSSEVLLTSEVLSLNVAWLKCFIWNLPESLDFEDGYQLKELVWCKPFVNDCNFYQEKKGHFQPNRYVKA